MSTRNTYTYPDRLRISLDQHDLGVLSWAVNDCQSFLQQRDVLNAERAMHCLAGHVTLGTLKTELLVRLTKRTLSPSQRSETTVTVSSAALLILMHWYLHHYHADHDQLRRVMSIIDQKLEDAFPITYNRLKL